MCLILVYCGWSRNKEDFYYEDAFLITLGFKNNEKKIMVIARHYLAIVPESQGSSNGNPSWVRF